MVRCTLEYYEKETDNYVSSTFWGLGVSNKLYLMDFFSPSLPVKRAAEFYILVYRIEVLHVNDDQSGKLLVSALLIFSRVSTLFFLFFFLLTNTVHELNQAKGKYENQSIYCTVGIYLVLFILFNMADRADRRF